MKAEAQRIAIAEVCGWKMEDGFIAVIPPRPITNVINPKGGWVYSYEGHGHPLNPSDAWLNIPDYLNDLNAMHEAEMKLTLEQRHVMRRIFYNWGKHNGRGYGESICHATATQRAEAFLRTLGKWEESP